MRVYLLGVRGSTPEPDPACAGYGGHTSCVAVAEQPADVPRLVLDAGTGVRLLDALVDGAFQGAVVLTHLHWDHLHGLPFSRALDDDRAHVELRLPVGARDAREELTHAMSPPVFPIGPDGLRGTWTFGDVPGAAPLTVGALSVRTSDVAHKGGRTVAVRVDGPTGSLAYLPDHCIADGVSDATRALLEGVDLLLHDAQFLPGEDDRAHAFGHATTVEAVDLARECGARTLVLTHHAPGRADSVLDGLDLDHRPGLQVRLARQGTWADVPPG